MGIPSYFNHIVKTKKDVLETLTNKNYKIDNFYLDCNSIIYNVIPTIEFINKEDFEYNLIQSVCEEIKNYIYLINPKKKVIIAFDGLSPFAKMKQQKERRLKSSLENKNTNWTTCNITPGTPFMKNLDISVKKYFNTMDMNCNIIISGSDEDGEGEHKIFEYIRNNKKYHKNKNTMIYGLDADLIMLCLLHLEMTNIYLFRETPFFIKSIDSSLIPNENYILNIIKLLKYIEIEMGEGSIHDYIFICFLLGNDFLPHFPALNIRTKGIYILMECYKNKINKKNRIIQNNIIQWKNLRLLLEYISLQEDSIIKTEFKNRTIFSKKIDKKSQVDIPLIDRRIEEMLNPDISGWKKKYYKLLFLNDDDEKRKKQISLNYLEGLEWTYKYYTTGCVNWKWAYIYNYPPLLQDLFKYIPYFECDMVKEDYTHLTREEQLSYVIPKKYNYIVPDIEIPECFYSIKWVYCRYFWESHIYFT